ncbi:CvpA family protein [Fodinibius halophilus]|uniref:CvpA family protein n=1 Tax=Fodinibius halophilus TaxID=1736908 RepID=A0A6M1T7P2_9BACT|nr:CvpA family protein [Fodinibius halophilus]NGP87144.1 CvpA family protein [Fodinibius halophilus]
MNLLDILILLPIAYFCYRGFMNGIIKEVLSIVGIILAVFFTFQYMEPVGRIIEPLFEEKASFVPFISGLVIFIGTVAGVNLIAYLSKKVLETIKLNFINRIAGALFSSLKSGIVISAVLLIMAGFSLPSQESRDASATYSYVIYFAPWAYDVVATIYPGAEDFKATIEQTLEKNNPINNFPTLDKNSNS